MPITQGAGNPDWNRDETLLALDLLYRHEKPIHKDHPDVIELSTLLQGPIFHTIDVRRPSFRNPDGVALKLQNIFSAIHPDRGLTSSELDREMVAAYPQESAPEVARLAQAVREAIARGDVVEVVPEEEVFTEGRVLTAEHRSRDRRLRKRLLEAKADHQLVCEICDFTAPALPRPLRESFFEAHHIRPLAEIMGVTQTRVRDMALLCACCHRFIHKLIVIERKWVSITEARTRLNGGD